VNRMRSDVLRTRPMGHAGAMARRALATRTGSSTAPGPRRGQGELEVPACHRLDWAKLAF
jgi:hypothetical protein